MIAKSFAEWLRDNPIDADDKYPCEHCKGDADLAENPEPCPHCRGDGRQAVADAYSEYRNRLNADRVALLAYLIRIQKKQKRRESPI